METVNEAKQAFLLISGDQLDKLRLGLLRYTLSKTRRWRWRTGKPTTKHTELPGGHSVGSIVNEAFAKAFSGERVWDPSRVETLQRFLEGIIDSLLWHLVTSSDNKLVDETAYDEFESGFTVSTVSPEIAWSGRVTPTPEQIVLHAERIRLGDIALRMLKKECVEDGLLTKIITKMQEGLDMPAELASAIGCAVKDVYKASKRLDRKCIGVGKRMWMGYGVGRTS